MKTLLPYILLLTLPLTLSAQGFPRLQKFSLAESGFQAYLPFYPENVELSWSDDSSKVWTGEVEGGDYLFGVICVEFAEPIGYNAEDNTALLESYLDYLKEAFEIVESAGYGYGHTLESTENAIGILDYWVDSDEASWSIKGWVSNRYLAVLYVGGDREPDVSSANMFLNGIRFPAE